MAKYASMVVEQAKSWLGCNEADGSHKQIIDVYNLQEKLPRSYPMKLTDPWCAAFVSGVAIKLGYTDIIPTECSCDKMIELFKKMDAWVEDDAYKPKPGDIIFYDWNDSGSGDNKGSSDHVGIVEMVAGDTIHVIEGNYSDAVKKRTLRVDGRYIRGYGVPKYDAEPEQSAVGYVLSMRDLKKGCKGEDVKALQILLTGYGCPCGTFWDIDGIFGSLTDAAVRAYQRSKALAEDGVVGAATWAKLLGT